MEYSTAQAVVDQVIEVDTLVTKLLKVLRLVQLDNDNCIQQLIVDKCVAEWEIPMSLDLLILSYFAETNYNSIRKICWRS